MKSFVRTLVIKLLGTVALLGTIHQAVAALGYTPATFNVSRYGAATYDIPIWAPPGPQGLQPSIALHYSSQQGNGPVGVGWSIAGLSSISRCTGTVAQDGAAAAVTLTYYDRFCLDGKRLRLTSSENLTTYGLDSTTYQTEVADFTNIIAHGAVGNGPAYFFVQQPNGTTYEYGNTTDSRVLAGSTTASAWMLDKVTDAAGNTMTFTYQQASANLTGTTVPASISWAPASYGATSSYQYTMVFNYQTLAVAPQSGYLAGQPVQNFYLLTGIQIQTGTTLKNYVLGYQPSGSSTTGRQLLSSVTECADAAASNCLIPTTIAYQPGQAGLETTATTLSGLQTNYQSWAVVNYDFNGDGISDIAVFDSGSWKVSFGSSSGYSAAIDTGITAANPPYVYVGFGDADGTGKDGILSPVNGVWWYYTWNGSAFAGVSTGVSVDSETTQLTNNSVALADVNGDGLPDLIDFSSNGYIRVRLNTSSGGTLSFSSVAMNTVSWSQYGMVGLFLTNKRHVDVYGSGQDDLVARLRLGQHPILLHFNGATFSLSSFPDQNVAYLADFNDDGCTDFLASTAVMLSACNGNAAVTIPLNSGESAVGAISWDGSSHDAVLVRHSGSLVLYTIEGSTLGPLTQTGIPLSGNAFYYTIPNPTGDGLNGLAAFSATTSEGPDQYYLHNGAGQPPDLLSKVTDGFGNSVSPTYVSMLQNNYSTYWNATYPDAPTSGYKHFAAPLYVVNQATFSDPSSASAATYQQTFWYYDAWENLQGRGFSGFKQVASHDLRNGLWNTIGYDGAFPADSQFAFDSTGFDQAGNQVVQYTFANDVTNTLDGTANNQRYFNYSNNITTQQYQVSWSPTSGSSAGPLISTTATAYAYDNYDNPTSITTTVTDNDSNSPYHGVSWVTTTTQTPFIDDPTYQATASSIWCLGLIETSQVAYSGGPSGTVPVTRHQSSSATASDLSRCRYTQTITEPGSAYQVTEGFGYDQFGNINSDTLTGSGMAARQTTTTWGPDGVFPATVIDPTGATTGTSTYHYNEAFGLPAQVTDPNGLTTTWIYDVFGRITLELRPDGTETTFNWASSTTCPPPYNGCGVLRNVVDVTKLDTLGKTVVSAVAAFDPLNRPFDVESNQTLAGGAVTVLTNYDSLGRIASRTQPFVWGSAQYLQSYYYDALNRVTQVKRPISAANTSLLTTAYQYQGDQTTVTDANGHSKVLTYDANGWLRESLDATNYGVILGYDAAGSPTSATDTSGNALWSRNYQYGIAPFQVFVNDTDLGAWTSNYDALGELIGWTDAKSQSFSMTYDALSRPLTRSEPDLFTQWFWGSSASAHEVGQLHSVCTGTGTSPTSCNSSGYAESETYDSASRLSQRAIQIPGDGTYTYTWAYNAAGLPDTLRYPATWYQLQVQYGYTNGVLASITNISDSPNVTLWTANAINAAGQVIQETLGNGVVVNHNFDAVTHLPSSITAGVQGGTGLQNNSFLFDYVGNLTQRQDNNALTTENAYPDSLNRLTSTVGDSNTQNTYDSIGRLGSWAVYGGTVNVNDYSTPASGCNYYANAQLHAVRQKTQGTGVATFCYDPNGNQVSNTWRGAQTASDTWTSYNQPNLITQGWPTIGTGTSTSQFFYDHNHQRWQQIASYSGSPETTEYIGDLTEKMVNANATQYRNYIPVGNTFVVYERSTATTIPATYYATKDHLGSTAVLTNQNGTLIANEKYSATGINETSAAQQTAASAITRREYTGQEALDNVFLTDLNARVYASSGMMILSPDPTLSDPTSTVGYNRYAYVNYNPLTFIDPSGYTCEGADIEHDCPDNGPTPADDNLPTVVISAPNASFIPSIGTTVTSGGLTLTVTSVQQGADMPEVIVNGSKTATQRQQVPSWTSSLARWWNTPNVQPFCGRICAVTGQRPKLNTATNGQRVMNVVNFASIVTAGLSGPVAGVGELGEVGEGLNFAGQTNRELNLLIGDEQRDLIREFLGVGLKGTNIRAANFAIPAGLTRQSLQIYAEIARRAIAEGIDKAGVQAARLALIQQALDLLQ